MADKSMTNGHCNGHHHQNGTSEKHSPTQEHVGEQDQHAKNPMDPEEFRVWGKKMVDYIADYWIKLRHRYHPLPRVHPGFMRELVAKTAPEHPEEFGKIFNDLERVIMRGVGGS